MPDEHAMLSRLIREVPDWPKPGILFYDITPLLGDPGGLSRAIKAMCRPFEDQRIDAVAAVEARGFIFGTAIAQYLSTGFIPVRKKGKLPYQTEQITYDLEYGTDTLEVHVDAVQKGANVLMVDDLLATGGTMRAACRLIEKIGGHVSGISCLIELSDLNGRQHLADYPIETVIRYS